MQRADTSSVAYQRRINDDPSPPVEPPLSPRAPVQRRIDPHKSVAFATSALSSGSAKASKAVKPNRTTKVSQKLTLFPQEKEIQREAAVVEEEEEENEHPDLETYDQIAQIPYGTARREAQRLTKLDRAKLPRVTAFVTAASYHMENLLKFLQSRKQINGTAPKRYDECIYTPFSYSYPPKPPHDSGAEDIRQPNSFTPLLTSQGDGRSSLGSLSRSSTLPTGTTDPTILPNIFFFEYGVVVFWGMTSQEEQKFLRDLERTEIEEEKLDDENIETEAMHFHYNPLSPPRVYNDVFTLRDPANHLVKLTISHAIAQSVKMSLFEKLIDDTIEETKDIPQQMADTGKVLMSRRTIMKKIGRLFIMRININLVNPLLDTPELMWSEPALEPLYTAVRGYLEISQRVELLNARVGILGDLLDMLKEHLTSHHGEFLEWVVIILIGFEIIIGLITISLDAYSYSQSQG